MPDVDSARDGERERRIAEIRRAFWRSNVLTVVVLLCVWAAVGPGCGVLFADVLNEHRFLGFRLGFWFAQQGSIVVFVMLILGYAVRMTVLDRRMHDAIAAIERELGVGRSAEDPR
jgi:putative solute:sodium symporter small subunit